MIKPATGLMIYESESKALASLMGVNLTESRKKIIESNHKKNVWVGIIEGYEHLDADDNPATEEEPESGYDNLDIDESLLPKSGKEVANTPVSSIAEMMDSPSGEGLQAKGVGKDGMPQEKTDTKGVSSKSKGGISLEGGAGGLKSGDSSKASPEDKGGEGIQAKGVGKDGMQQEKTELKGNKSAVKEGKENEDEKAEKDFKKESAADDAEADEELDEETDEDESTRA